MNTLGANGNGFDRGGKGPSNCIAYPNLHQVFGSQGATVASQIQVRFLDFDFEIFIEQSVIALVQGVELGSVPGRERSQCYSIAEDFPDSGGSDYEEEWWVPRRAIMYC